MCAALLHRERYTAKQKASVGRGDSHSEKIKEMIPKSKA